MLYRQCNESKCSDMVWPYAEKKRWQFVEGSITFLSTWTLKKETKEHMEENSQRRDEENWFDRRRL